MTTFPNALSEEIWRSRYRFEPPGEAPEPSIDATWDAASRERLPPSNAPTGPFGSAVSRRARRFPLSPGGRILAGAGTRRRVTLFNCFVMGQIDDSMDGIFGACAKAR
jgi:ribonucleoside-diphosphate reductase alpha chain